MDDVCRGGFEQVLPEIIKRFGGEAFDRLLVPHYAERLAAAHLFKGFGDGVAAFVVYEASDLLDNQPLFNRKIGN